MTAKDLKDNLKNVKINTIISKDIPPKDKLKNQDKHTHQQDWQVLRKFTPARIAIGRAGISVPTQAMLDFQLAHAQAQDAVHLPLNNNALTNGFQNYPHINADHSEIIQLHSQVQNRAEYLQRPDLGRLLNKESIHSIKNLPLKNAGYDLAIVIVDGLSSLAIQKNATLFLDAFYKKIVTDTQKTNIPSITIAPLTLVNQGRVAIGDEVAHTLNAKSVLVLIGERPGLSSPDSLGMYYTYAPKIGLTDESRNCISNIRKGGLSFSQAANKAFYLLNESHKLKISGVNLKENYDQHALDIQPSNKPNTMKHS